MNLRFSPPLRGITASIGSMFGRGRDKEADEAIVDFDKDGEFLYKEDVLKFLSEELERRRRDRSGLELQWTLNANFLVGNQFCDINTYTGQIEQLTPAYDWLERETFNQIAPLIETRIANLKKINYMMKVNPCTNEMDDFAKAEISTNILQRIQKQTDFENKKNMMISWNEVCGSCFWLCWWNPNKGNIALELDTTVETDDGVVTKKQAIYEGDIDYGLLTPYEVFPESVFKQGVESQRSIIIEQVKTVEDIRELYGIDVKGETLNTFELTPVPSANGLGRESTVMTIGHRSVEDSQRVITFFERPSALRPNGRMIIAIGDKELVYYGDMPYSEIPLVQSVCRDLPGQFFGKSVIDDLIPRQRAYNGCMNRIHEYIKRIAIQSYIAEEGSIDMDDFMENGCAPGAIIEYAKGFDRPSPINNGNLPAEIMEERYNLVRDMEYVAGVSQLATSGSAPSGITSGMALEALKATDDTRLSLTGDRIRLSVQNLARMFLKICKTFATTRRVCDYVGLNSIGNAFVWSSEDINSFDVEFTTENELVMSEDMQRQRFIEAMQMGLFTDANGRIPERTKLRALESMKFGNYSEIMSVNTLQIQAAQRENVFFSQGIIPEISDFDDHEIHYDEHLRYLLQMDFQLLKKRKPDYAMALEEHAKMHKKLLEQSAMPPQLEGGMPYV